MKANFFVLIGLLAIGGLAQAGELENLKFQFRGEQAQEMLEHSVKTGETMVLNQHLFGVDLSKNFEVYSFDSNWKCYKPNTDSDSLKKHVLRGVLDDYRTDAFCVYKLGQNIGGASKGPEQIHPRIYGRPVVDTLIAAGKAVDDQELHFPRPVGEDKVVYHHYVAKDWDCYRVKNADDARPGFWWSMGGARLPQEFCTYISPAAAASGSDLNSDSAARSER